MNLTIDHDNTTEKLFEELKISGDIPEKYILPRYSYMYIAHNTEGIIVGFVGLNQTDHWYDMWGLTVLPIHRQKGYGRAIVRELMRIVREDHGEEILAYYLDTESKDITKLLQFYQPLSPMWTGGIDYGLFSNEYPQFVLDCRLPQDQLAPPKLLVEYVREMVDYNDPFVYPVIKDVPTVYDYLNGHGIDPASSESSMEDSDSDLIEIKMHYKNDL